MEGGSRIKDEENHTESISGNSKADEKQDIVHSIAESEDDKLEFSNGLKMGEARLKSIPPPGSGQKIYEIDPLLRGHREHLDYR